MCFFISLVYLVIGSVFAGIPRLICYMFTRLFYWSKVNTGLLVSCTRSVNRPFASRLRQGHSQLAMWRGIPLLFLTREPFSYWLLLLWWWSLIVSYSYYHYHVVSCVRCFVSRSFPGPVYMPMFVCLLAEHILLLGVWLPHACLTWEHISYRVLICYDRHVIRIHTSLSGGTCSSMCVP